MNNDVLRMSALKQSSSNRWKDISRFKHFWHCTLEGALLEGPRKPRDDHMLTMAQRPQHPAVRVRCQEAVARASQHASNADHTVMVVMECRNPRQRVSCTTWMKSRGVSVRRE